MAMHLSLNMSVLPERPWQKLNTDFYGPSLSREYVLLPICQYTRYPVAEIVYSAVAEAVIPKLDKVFGEFGLPEELVSDNGSAFQGEEMQQYALYILVFITEKSLLQSPK